MDIERLMEGGREIVRVIEVRDIVEAIGMGMDRRLLWVLG